MSVLEILDDVPAGDGRVTDWWYRVEQSLQRSPEDWTAAIAEAGRLDDGRAWALLGWIEVAAGQVVRTRSRNLLALSAFATALVRRSHLDPRDCSIVASLLRRAAELAGLDFSAAVAEGTLRAGSFGGDARDLLLHASAALPATHQETGDGETFAFTRVPSGIDVAALEDWLGGDGT